MRPHQENTAEEYSEEKEITQSAHVFPTDINTTTPELVLARPNREIHRAEVVTESELRSQANRIANYKLAAEAVKTSFLLASSFTTGYLGTAETEKFHQADFNIKGLDTNAFVTFSWGMASYYGIAFLSSFLDPDQHRYMCYDFEYGVLDLNHLTPNTGRTAMYAAMSTLFAGTAIFFDNIRGEFPEFDNLVEFADYRSPNISSNWLSIATIFCSALLGLKSIHNFGKLAYNIATYKEQTERNYEALTHEQAELTEEVIEAQVELGWNTTQRISGNTIVEAMAITSASLAPHEEGVIEHPSASTNNPTRSPSTNPTSFRNNLEHTTQSTDLEGLQIV